jgi:hypothetical protein
MVSESAYGTVIAQPVIKHKLERIWFIFEQTLCYLFVHLNSCEFHPASVIGTEASLPRMRHLEHETVHSSASDTAGISVRFSDISLLQYGIPVSDLKLKTKN